MTQLRSDSSRSYPGRSDRRAAHLGSVDGSNIANDRSEVSRGHSTCSHTGKGRTQEGIGVPASSPSAFTPEGPVSQRRVADQPNPNTSLLERILSRENMLTAWQQVKDNQGSYGVDKMTITALPEYARAHWADIRASLLAGTYKPLPVRRVEIPKPAGGKRPLGIPTVLDRMIQQGFWVRSLIRHSRYQASVTDPGDPPTRRFTSYAGISNRAIAWPWTWTYRSSSIRSTTMHSCIAWPNMSMTSVSYA